MRKKFFNIQLANDAHLYPVPDNSQYYFDESSELLFVRYTFPFLRKEKKDETYVPVELSSGSGYLKLLQGGTSDKNIGVYHEVFAIESIISLQ